MKKEENIDLSIFGGDARKKLKEKELFLLALGLDNLPFEVLKRIAKSVLIIEGWGIVNENKIKEAACFFSKEILENYTDQRFKIFDGFYLRILLKEYLNEIVGGKHNLKNEDFHFIIFDVNGLKSINDNFGHHAGDRYLKKIVNCLKGGRVTKSLIEKNVDFKLTSNGGDEFVVILNRQNSDDCRAGEWLKEIINLYRKEIREINCSDIIDLEKIRQSNIFKGLNIKIPDNFQFYASAGIGGSTFSEIFCKLKDDSYEDYDDFVSTFIRRIINTCSTRVGRDKECFKKNLYYGNECDQILFLFLLRNRENILSQQKIQELENEIIKMQNNLRF